MSDTIRIPAREGHALRLAAGERVRVIDPEGGQVADVFAYCADDLSEYHSAEHTRVFASRLFPRVGEQFVTNRRRPILTLEADDSPGIHDMLCAACDPTRYAGLGVDGWHASCQENLLTAMADLGYGPVEIPQPINLFMNIPVRDDWEIGWEPAPTKAGDSVTLRAELDIVLAVSACPQDIVRINAGNPTPIDLERLDA
ncbi:MAG TPA: urea carboxylase-associated family protein [Gaiellales bacterium]|nr:urea carboxylase-associated family protein [Gaiellales bacterium]